MTKDNSHRQLFLSMIVDDGYSIEAAAAHVKIDPRTARRWLEMLEQTGQFLPLRFRSPTTGKMRVEDQEALFAIIANNRTMHLDELCQRLFEDTGHFYTERLIRQVMHRRNYVYKLANHLAPLERDEELRRYWREQILDGVAGFTSDQFIFVDESSKKLKDCRRPRVFAVRGDLVEIPVVHTRSGNAASIIASLSLEGVQSISVVDVNEEGNINGERFLQAFVEDILVLCEPFPGKRSVVVMDNAQIHLKLLIKAECFERDVLIFFLPPYSFDYNPIELCFNTAKMKLKRDYGLNMLPPDVIIGDLFRTCLLTCMTPDIACNMFERCYVQVSDAERAWASR
jgi:transposase